MYSRPIDIHNIEEGLDRKQLSQLKQRFLNLNQQRYQRTCDALSERQQQFLHLLPLLFHVNHPMLPGYIAHTTPAGLYQFSPSPEQLRMAKILARSFTYKRDLNEKKAQIDALFIMGSIGTIAHSDTSDLDVWVCHSIEQPDSQALHELQRKCTLISQWAAQQIHLEVHFFLMHAEDFAQRRNLRMSSEASGSAQHYLLLDEFYRTALWLGGKVPLWWFVPSSRERDYNQYRATLLGRRFIKPQDLIDFGGLPDIPANEFIGAGVWQLYKAIESPYKSVLKLLLLEVYASAARAPSERQSDALADASRPLALSLKEAIYQGETNPDLLDPYVMVYRRIEQYLKHHQQSERLELVRRCFYFKVNKTLSRNSRQRKTWQQQLLEQLVSDWHWSSQQLLMLDNRSEWKSPHVLTERALLVNELTHSYRLLNQLHTQHRDHIAISHDELIILGRKLHAAFERKAGKVEFINPGIARDIGEQSLCFICTEQNQIAHQPQISWQLVRGSQQDLTLRNREVTPLKRSLNFIELLLWSHANQILQSHTQIDVVGTRSSISFSQKQQLRQTLQQWLPVPVSTEHQAFTRSAQISQILLIINTGVEPQEELHKKGMHMLSSQNDALGYSGLRENLIINADIIHLNSWGELVSRHFANDALVNCLLYYFRLFAPGKNVSLPPLSIRCFSAHQGQNIAQRLNELWRDLIGCFYSGTRPRNSRYILEMGDEYLLLQFVQQQAQIYRFKHYDKLIERLSLAQTDYSPIVIDRHGLHNKPLRLIAKVINPGAIYLFYSLAAGQAQVTLVDERGSLFVSQMSYHTPDILLRPLIHFIQAASRRQWLDSHNNLDNQTMPELMIYELVGNSKQQQGQAIRREPEQHWSTGAHYIHIKAIAEMDQQQRLQYTLFCDEQEFSSLSYGDQLLTEVAKYIMAKRQPGEPYPCYISDLDLSLCQEVIAQQTGLQLSHYLQIKRDLEEQLNRALQQL